MQTKTNYENISFSYEALGNSSYLVAAFRNGMAPINYQVEMLSANEIPNILPANKHQKNAEIQMYYNVTSKISLAQAFGRQKMSKENFLTLIIGAVNAFKEVEEYQLVNTGILLDPDIIFIKTGTFEPAFVYLPVFTEDEGIKRLRKFMIKLILKDVIEVSNDNFIQLLLSRLNSETMSLSELEKLLNGLKRSVSSVGCKINNPPPPQPQPVVHPDLPKPAASTPANLPNIPKGIPSSKKDAQVPTKESPTENKKPITKILIMAGVQVLFLLGTLGLFSSGGLNLKTGGIDPSKVLGVLIFVGGIDFVLYRELFKHQNGAKQPKPGQPGGAASVQKPVAAAVPQPLVQPAPQPVLPSAPPYMPPAAPPVMNNYRAAGSDDTVILSENKTGNAYLEIFENGIYNKIALDKPSIIIGRLRGQVDYIVANSNVGKIHAEFISREGCYFVKDYNSTNGTYINGSGQRITSNVEFQIFNNDRISLANQDFILKC